MDLQGDEGSMDNATVMVKEEPLDVNVERRTIQQAQLPGSYNGNDEDSEQQIECTTESQENEIRLSLSKCVFCNKSFTAEDEPKLLECLHAVCSGCINTKLSEHDPSVDVDVMRKIILILFFVLVSRKSKLQLCLTFVHDCHSRGKRYHLSNL